MIKEIFKARMVDDFEKCWLAAASKDEDISIEQSREYYGKFGHLRELSDRISGRIVELSHNTYVVGEDDFFESIDNNFVIFPELFERI